MQTRRNPKKSKQLEESTMFSEKRKASPLRETRKIKKRTFEGREIDVYCWVCHTREREMDQNLICNSCPRVYHSECTRKIPFNAQGSCAECQSQSVSEGNEPTNISRLRLKELLKFAFQEAIKEDKMKTSSTTQPEQSNSNFCKYFKTWPVGITETLCQIIDLDILIDKINDDINYYLTTAEFFSDVKWIYHNCCILHGVYSDITKSAQKLEKNFKKELLDIEACAECYYIKHTDDYVDADFFTLVCKEPHDIVWAKLRRYPYWPAKCLKIRGGKADVRFFGMHEKSIVPINQCYRISEKSPKEIKRSMYVHAMNELSVYIHNYENKIGNFQYYPPKTPLTDSKQRNIKKICKKDVRQKNLYDDCESSEAVDIVESPDYSHTAKSEHAHILDRHFQVSASSQDPVSVRMDFSTDDDESSSLGPFSLKNAPLHRNGLKASASVEQLSQGSSHFVNSSGPDILPVITSATSEVGSSNDNSVTEHSDLLQSLSDMLANTPSTSKKEIAASGNPVNKAVKGNRAEDEDDLNFDKEKVASPTAANADMNNPHLIHALSELVQSNHPHLQDFYKKCMDFGLKSFLRLWLATDVKWQGVNAVLLFATLYEKISLTSSNTKKENEELHNINKLLTQESNALKEQLQNMKSQLTTNEVKRKLQEHLTNTKKVIGILLSKFRSEWESYDHNELNENVLLAKKVKQYEEVLSKKDSKIKELEDKIQHLVPRADSDHSINVNGENDL